MENNNSSDVKQIDFNDMDYKSEINQIFKMLNIETETDRKSFNPVTVEEDHYNYSYSFTSTTEGSVIYA